MKYNMRSAMGKFGAQQHITAPVCSSQLRLLKKSTTYLSRIAVALQDAPGKMLTFTQLMEKLLPLMSEDRKSVENNIRVCLSSNSCFVKIPVVPDTLDSKKNYWKLDTSKITAKMVRRHFKGILQLFPELASKVEIENSSRASDHSPAPASPKLPACRDVQIRCEVKFSGPFSIESLLRRDSPSTQVPSASPLCSTSVSVEQGVGAKRSFSWDPQHPRLLQTSAGFPPVCPSGGSTHHGLSVQPMRTYSEPPFQVYSRAAPYYSSPHSSYITHSVPTFTHNAPRYRL